MGQEVKKVGTVYVLLGLGLWLADYLIRHHVERMPVEPPHVLRKRGLL